MRNAATTLIAITPNRATPRRISSASSRSDGVVGTVATVPFPRHPLSARNRLPPEKQTPESCLSGVLRLRPLARSELTLSEHSERTQQNRTHKHKHRTKRQGFKSQGKVHKELPAGCRGASLAESI